MKIKIIRPGGSYRSLLVIPNPILRIGTGDGYRTIIKNDIEIEVLRIKIEEIERDMESVLERLKGFISNRTHPVVPLLKTEGRIGWNEGMSSKKD